MKKFNCCNDTVEDLRDIRRLGTLTPFKAYDNKDEVWFDLIRTYGLFDAIPIVSVEANTGDMRIVYHKNGTVKCGLFCNGLFVKELWKSESSNPYGFSKGFSSNLWTRQEAENLALEYTGRDLLVQSRSALRKMKNDVSFFIPVDKKDAARVAYAHDTVVGDTMVYSYDNLVDAEQFRDYCREKLDLDTVVVESARHTYLAGLEDWYSMDEE